jgi:hypothetical protein
LAEPAPGKLGRRAFVIPVRFQQAGRENGNKKAIETRPYHREHRAHREKNKKISVLSECSVVN